MTQSFSEGIDNPTFDGTEETKTELEDVLLSLHELKLHLCDVESQEDVEVLMEIILQRDFQKAFSLHRSIALSTKRLRPPHPLTVHARNMRDEVESVLKSSKQTEATELTALLSSAHLKALMEAHDSIAEQDFNVDDIMEPHGKGTKLVCLEKKRNMPLGVTVRNDGDRVLISRVIRGGTVEKSGLLGEGDEILHINGISVCGKSINDVHNILSSMHGPLSILIMPNSQNKTSAHRRTLMHVKANFTYDPSDDPYVPCRDLALFFYKGDVLHVTSQDDPHWWQAYRDADENQKPLSGLIPGKNFQQQREALKKTITDKNQEQRGKLWRSKKYKRQRKIHLDGPNNVHYSDDILPYEEVSLYHQPADRKRPIVLIGPPNSGQEELRQRLLSLEPGRFAGAVPHTTRSPRAHEVSGREYNFVSRQSFECDLASGKFLESGEFEQNLYGTSTDSVRQIINSGKICLLCLQPRILSTHGNPDAANDSVFNFTETNQ